MEPYMDEPLLADYQDLIADLEEFQSSESEDETKDSPSDCDR